MKKIIVLLFIVLVGCSTWGETQHGTPTLTFNHWEYSLELRGLDKIVVVKNGGQPVFIDKLYLSIDGKTYVADPVYDRLDARYKTAFWIDYKIREALQDASFVSWRPGNYEDVKYDLVGKDFLMLKEFYAQF